MRFASLTALVCSLFALFSSSLLSSVSCQAALGLTFCNVIPGQSATLNIDATTSVTALYNQCQKQQVSQASALGTVTYTLVSGASTSPGTPAPLCTSNSELNLFIAYPVGTGINFSQERTASSPCAVTAGKTRALVINYVVNLPVGMQVYVSSGTSFSSSKIIFSTLSAYTSAVGGDATPSTATPGVTSNLYLSMGAPGLTGLAPSTGVMTLLYTGVGLDNIASAQVGGSFGLILAGVYNSTVTPPTMLFSPYVPYSAATTNSQVQPFVIAAVIAVTTLFMVQN